MFFYLQIALSVITQVVVSFNPNRIEENSKTPSFGVKIATELCEAAACGLWIVQLFGSMTMEIQQATINSNDATLNLKILINKNSKISKRRRATLDSVRL